jgi:hypothetical protein
LVLRAHTHYGLKPTPQCALAIRRLWFACSPIPPGQHRYSPRRFAFSPMASVSVEHYGEEEPSRFRAWEETRSHVGQPWRRPRTSF